MSLTDRQLLHALDLAEDGVQYQEIAERLGTTKGAIAGHINRCRSGVDKIGPAKDGTMPKYWYLDGLRKQERRS